MKKLTISVILLFAVLLAGCDYYTEITQESNLWRAIDCTYRVSTHLWVRKYIFPFDRTVTLEKQFYAYDLKKSEIETVKAQQLAAIRPYEIKVKKALAEGSCK